MVCKLCGGINFKEVYPSTGKSAPEPGGYRITSADWHIQQRIVKCRGCGLIFKEPMPPPATLRYSYVQMEDEKYLEEEKGRRIAARPILRELMRLKKSGRILDVGCATGFLLDEAKKEGWESFGVELSKWAAGYAREEFGIEVFQGNLKDAGFPEKFFDAVILKDTIEHLYDPKDTLLEIRRILKPDGILVLNTPDIDSLMSKLLRARWWGIKQEHLYYFNQRTLFKLLEATGFKPVKCRSHSRTFSLRYWTERFGKYSGPLYKILLAVSSCKTCGSRLLTINLRDQIEVYARKSRQLKFIKDWEAENITVQPAAAKVIAVLPAFNAARTLRRTVSDIPAGSVNEMILVDDASKDATVNIARQLGLKVFVHERNRGYGANQKTCYTEALKTGADIVVMVHPDYQYDPKVIPELIAPIKQGRADAVFGSRMMKGGALEGGMPVWKHNANVLLTALENVVLGTYLTEYHSGFRAYSAKYLKSVNFLANSDDFVFDTEIIVQGLLKNMLIEEIPIRTRYFDEASTIKLWPCILYGIGILKTLLKYILHSSRLIRFKQFA